jgi:MYXO-CTERM domain-containing protein
MPVFRGVWLVGIALVALAPGTARATYSIVAADRATRQVGGAVTSCVAPNGVGLVYGSSPGLGAVASQAASNRAGRDRAVQLLQMNVAPAQIIQTLTSVAFDPGSARRQYGVIDLMGRAAGHSGTSNGVFSDDLQGNSGDFTYSIQGNILTGALVLSQAQAAFRDQACDLAERLMRALEAGAVGNQGDRRCTPDGAPSDSAFIQVDRPGEPVGSFLRLSVVSPRRTSPLPALRVQFDAWRRTHPCPAGMPQPPAVPTDAGADTAPVDPPRQDASRPPDTAVGSGGVGGGAGTGGSGGTRGGSPAMGGLVTPPEKPRGCECRAGGGGPVAFPALLLLAAGLLVARRRRRS